ncbi:MAG: 6-phosphogluconolactonase [Bacteroidales bacterium]|nr:6-phosphogluconolactonase [Bacteroidales bacterium]
MEKQTIYRVYPSKEILAEAFAGELARSIIKTAGRKAPFTLALSGGSTPVLLFEVLAEKYSKAVDWSKVKIFWVDERCVPPEDPESNYGMTRRLLLDKINIPSANVFRMRGEDEPLSEAARYSEVIASNTRTRNNLPYFDTVLLGMGEDGHTASIFPGNAKLLHSRKICDTALHPATKQKRVTLTGKVINNAKSVAFIVTGNAKSVIVDMIYTRKGAAKIYPAAHIRSVSGVTIWLLDEDAGKFIK